MSDWRVGLVRYILRDPAWVCFSSMSSLVALDRSLRFASPASSGSIFDFLFVRAPDWTASAAGLSRSCGVMSCPLAESDSSSDGDGIGWAHMMCELELELELCEQEGFEGRLLRGAPSPCPELMLSKLSERRERLTLAIFRVRGLTTVMARYAAN
jgi:hypothetical protein